MSSWFTSFSSLPLFLYLSLRSLALCSQSGSNTSTAPHSYSQASSSYLFNISSLPSLLCSSIPPSPFWNSPSLPVPSSYISLFLPLSQSLFLPLSTFIIPFHLFLLPSLSLSLPLPFSRSLSLSLCFCLTHTNTHANVSAHTHTHTAIAHGFLRTCEGNNHSMSYSCPECPCDGHWPGPCGLCAHWEMDVYELGSSYAWHVIYTSLKRGRSNIHTNFTWSEPKWT